MVKMPKLIKPIHIFILPVILAGVFGFFVNAHATVMNSKHDFSASGTGGLWGTATVDEVCIFCHTPHDASLTEQPLWNRAETINTYTVYSSETLNASMGDPLGVSKLCLSCHDGSIAIDAFLSNDNPPVMMKIGDVYYPGSPFAEGGANIGGLYMTGSGNSLLSDDHPISFIYDSNLASADGKLVDPVNLPETVPLFGDRLECATCHDVHNVESNGAPALLRVNNSGSDLCLTCHIK